jgi:phytoene desaturase
MTSSHCDVVVIGAGLGGLAAAAALARTGRSVIVVERQDGPGGCAHSFRRGPYHFDPAVHVSARGFDRPFLDPFLAAVGALDLVDLVEPEALMTVVLPGLRLTVPRGLAAATETIAEQFPEDARGIREFFALAAQVTRESQQPPPRVGLNELESTMTQLPNLFRHRMSTVSEVLDGLVADPSARAVCGAQWPYIAMPPSKASFLTYAATFTALADTGVYVRGTFQQLADALVHVISAHGGEVVLGTAVTAIRVEDGRATGIELEDGTRIDAGAVISNADATQTLEELVGPEHVPDPVIRRLRRMTPSLSGFFVYSATTADVRASGLAHETFVYRHVDHDETYRDILAGRPGGIWLSFPTLHDPSLAPEGEHLVVLTSLAPYELETSWAESREAWTEEMLDTIEGVLPGYRDGLTFMETGTPHTLEAFTRNHRGALYGWDNAPAQAVSKRLTNRPLPGLVLAGHWTAPGSGSLRVLFSGLQAAAVVTGHASPFELLGELLARGVGEPAPA